jgi:hypothetical protein
VVSAIVICVVAAASLWLLAGDRDPGGRSQLDLDGVAVEHPGSSSLIPAAPLSPRSRTHAAWSGTELLVWSGAVPGDPDLPGATADKAFQVLEDGAAYDPATDSWRVLPAAPVSGRVGAAAVWAGDRLVVWGGFSGPDRALDDGAAYLPGQDTWLRLPPAPITARGDVTAVWTGREVLIIGGAERVGRPGRVSGVQRDGAAYDPVANRWRTIPAVPDGVWPLRDRGVWPIRERFAGTWTGEALFVWGRDVALYHPATDVWQHVPAPLTGVRIGGGVAAVRVGDQVVVIGLATRDDPETFGLRYDSSSGMFGPVPGLLSDPMNRPRQVVATDADVLVLQTDPDRAAVWSPGAATWRTAPPTLARGTEAVAVWTGEQLLIWGGSVAEAVRTDGIAWTP